MHSNLLRVFYYNHVRFKKIVNIIIFICPRENINYIINLLSTILLYLNNLKNCIVFDNY